MKNKPYPLYSLPEITDLKDMVKKHAKNAPDRIAFSYLAGKDKIENKTYKEFDADVDAFGTFLYSKGLKNAHIAIVGENSYEWLVAFMAIVNGGNVAVPIDKEQPPDKLRQLLKQSDCNAVIVSGKLMKHFEKTEIPVLSIVDFSEYIVRGQMLIDSKNTEYADYEISREKLAAIFFTSGTTGNSKGVMLSHKNMAADINSASRSFLLSGSTVAVLPFYHTFGLITAVFKVFHYGYPIYINQSLKRIQKDLQNIKPQTIFLVPLFVETFYKTIIDTARKGGKEKKLNKGMKISNFLLRLGMDFRRKLFKDVQAAFGGKLEYVICGGAPLDPKYVKAFRSWGVSILNGYGITECSPVVSVNRNHYGKDGSVGQMIDKCEVRISDEGEILVKGNNVMLGYYKDEAATKQVLHDGWYATGDIGYVDDDGFLFLTGRKKNLIILSNGENVSPEELEAPLLLDEAVAEAVVYAEDGILAIQIYPTEEYREDKEYFRNLMDEFNKKQPPYMRIHKLVLRKTEFKKNATKKILRHKIMEESA